jgi:hypothetical protein
MLFQAKIFKNLPVKPDNPDQYHLYAYWPPFEYTRSSKLNRAQRHIFGPDIHGGTKYLLIRKSDDVHGDEYCCSLFGCCSCMPYLRRNCLLSAQPTPTALSHYRCFVSELIEFILGDAGKAFKTPHANDKNWNRVIKDLTDETGACASVFMGHASGCPAIDRRGNTLVFSRGSRDGLSFLSEDSWDAIADRNEAPPEVPANRSSDDDDERSGISIISFVVNDDSD